MLIEKYVNVVLNEDEYELIQQIAKEQNISDRIVMRNIFNEGLSEMKYYRKHEMPNCPYVNKEENNYDTL